MQIKYSHTANVFILFFYAGSVRFVYSFTFLFFKESLSCRALTLMRAQKNEPTPVKNVKFAYSRVKILQMHMDLHI